MFAQTEGIKKGDKELNVSGNFSYNKYETSSFTNGLINVSFGRYLNDLMIVGIASGVSMSQSEGSSKVNYDLNAQLFTNVNILKKGRFIPYGRAAIYNAGLSIENSSFVQIGGGMKFFFAKRAAWDSLFTYGFGLSGDAGNSKLFLTGLSYLF